MKLQIYIKKLVKPSVFSNSNDDRIFTNRFYSEQQMKVDALEARKQTLTHHLTALRDNNKGNIFIQSLNTIKIPIPNLRLTNFIVSKGKQGRLSSIESKNVSRSGFY